MKTNKTITIKRLQKKSENSNIKEWQEVGTESVFVIPLSDEMTAIANEQGIFGQSYQVFARLGADIKETDKLIIDGEEYDVKGIKKYEGSNNLDHLEILANKIQK